MCRATQANISSPVTVRQPVARRAETHLPVHLRHPPSVRHAAHGQRVQQL